MQRNVQQAIQAATQAGRITYEKLEAAQRVSALSPGDQDTINALRAALGAQAALSEALMRLCCTLARQCPDPAEATCPEPLTRDVN